MSVRQRGAGRVQSAGVAYGATLERLRQVKAAAFRLNQNIEPTERAAR